MIATANLARQLETIEEVKLGPSIVGTFIHNGHNDAVQSLLDLSFHYLHHGQKYHGEQDRPNFKIGADYDTVLQGLLADHDEVEVNKLLASIVAVLRTIIKNRAKVSDVRSSLSAIGFQDAFTEAIVQKLMTSRRELEYSAVVNGFHFNRLEKLRWRVDVTISCSALAKVMRPNILFQVFWFPYIFVDWLFSSLLLFLYIDGAKGWQHTNV